MERICVIGAGGHGREIAAIVFDLDPTGERYQLIGFVDDAPDMQGKIIMGLPVIGTVEDVLIRGEDPPLPIIGLGDPAVKRTVMQRLSNVIDHWPTIIHPTSRITSSTTIGEGCVIFPGSVLSVDVTIGDFVHINTGCSISHDSTIGDGSIINPGTMINGNVSVGKECNIGAGTIFIQNTKIGDRSITGAGSVVIDDLPSDVTCVGVPATIVKKHNEA